MEAARVAASRGHRVSLLEKEQQLGGLLPMAMFIKSLENENLYEMLRYYRTQLAKLGVTVNLGQAVTPSLVDQLRPDAVVVAAGGSYAMPEIPGIDSSNVLTSAALASRAKLPLRLLGPQNLR